MRDTANRFVWSVLLKSRKRTRALAPSREELRRIYGPSLRKSRAKNPKLRVPASVGRGNPFKIWWAGRRSSAPISKAEAYRRVQKMVAERYKAPSYTAATFNPALAKLQKAIGPDAPIRITKGPRHTKGDATAAPALARDEQRPRINSAATFQATHFWGRSRRQVDPRVSKILAQETQRERAATIKYGERQMAKQLRRAGWRVT